MAQGAPGSKAVALKSAPRPRQQVCRVFWSALFKVKAALLAGPQLQGLKEINALHLK